MVFIPAPQTAMLRVVGDLDLSNWLVPSACLVGSDLNGRLLLRSLAPLIVIIAVPTVGGALSAVQRLRRPSYSAPDDSMRSTLASAPKDRARRQNRSAMQQGAGSTNAFLSRWS